MKSIDNLLKNNKREERIKDILNVSAWTVGAFVAINTAEFVIDYHSLYKHFHDIGIKNSMKLYMENMRKVDLILPPIYGFCLGFWDTMDKKYRNR